MSLSNAASAPVRFGVFLGFRNDVRWYGGTVYGSSKTVALPLAPARAGYAPTDSVGRHDLRRGALGLRDAEYPRAPVVIQI